MKIGIYGGTFNPPHMGHMDAAKSAMGLMKLDRLLIIPDNEPPHKEMGVMSASPEDRLAMAELMADGMRMDVQALDIEIKREGKSYTADTVEQIREMYPDDELWFLTGTDMFLTIHNWFEPERIFACVGVAVFARYDEDTLDMFEEQSRRLEQQFGARTQIVKLPKVRQISSRELRTMLMADWNGSTGSDNPAKYIWPPVYGYILKNGLYGTKADLKNLTDAQLRAVSYSMIKAKRIPHVRGTEETAVKLAEFWGENAQLARRAAILHDCTKYWELEPDVALCDQYGVALDEEERVNVKFLHSKTGAIMAKYIFGEPEEVFEAIFCHTTGMPGMSRLAKILYLADYMEPNRDFEGVEEMRRLVYEDLDKAMIMGLQMTIDDLKERGASVHRNTQGTMDWLKG